MKISRAQLRHEIDDLLNRARIDPASVKLTFSRALDREHARDHRTHAQIDLVKREIEVARAILSLDAAHRLGILAHEVGHLRCQATIGPKHTEDQTDRCALEATDVLISYDRSWPGRHPDDPTIQGLQVGTDLKPRRKSSAQLEADIKETLASLESKALAEREERVAHATKARRRRR